MNTISCALTKKTAFQAALAQVRLPRDRKFVVARLTAHSNADAALLATNHPITRTSAQITAVRAMRRPPVVAALTAGLAFIEEVLAHAGADAIQPTNRIKS